MILADTNVLSALMQAEPDRAVIRWLDGQPHTSIWTTSVSVMEIRYGIEIMVSGRRRAALSAAFERLLTEVIDARVATFDRPAAEEAARLLATRKAGGHPMELRDTMIAGIALASHAAIATRNIRHFEDVSCTVINPWSA